MGRHSLMAVGLAVVAFSSGCATVQVQREKASAVKTVAIIGFSGVTELEDKNGAKSGVGDIMNSVKGSTDLFSGELDKRRIAQAEATYAKLEQQLEATTGWQIVERTKLATDEAYQAQLKEHPNTDTLMATGLQRLPDVLRPEFAWQMDEKQRAELCQRLGVDAVAVAKVRYVIGSRGGFTVGGMGKTTIYPKAIIEWTVLDGTTLPVWKDRYAAGEPTTEGLENVMGAKNNENETQVLAAAADSAIGKLVERYKTP